MKKYIILLMVVLGINDSYSQVGVELTPLFGVTVNGRVESYFSTFKISDDMSFGGLLAITLSDYEAVEFSYKRSNNTVNEFYYPELQNYYYDIGIEHYQLGFQKMFKTGKVKPFAEIAFGTSRYFLKDTNWDAWSFSGSFGGGVKYFFTDRIGLRLQSNLILPLQFSGAGFFCGVSPNGTGCSTSTSFHVPTVHWESSIGLIFKVK